MIERDIFKCDENLIVYQANCKGKMGKGMALDIRRKYPEVYNKFIDNYNTYGDRCFGHISCAPTRDGKIFIIMYGQLIYSKYKKCTSEKAVRNAMRELNEYARKTKQSVAIPYKIGCGLGGGEWQEVLKIIEEELIDCEYNIYRKVC